MSEPGEIQHLCAQLCLLFSNSDITIQNAFNALTKSERYHLLKNISYSMDYSKINTVFGCSEGKIKYWRDCKCDLTLEEAVNCADYVNNNFGKDTIYSLLRGQTIIIPKCKEI